MLAVKLSEFNIVCNPPFLLFFFPQTGWSCNVCVSSVFLQGLFWGTYYSNVVWRELRFHQNLCTITSFVWSYLSHSRWNSLLNTHDAFCSCIGWRALHFCVFSPASLPESLVNLNTTEKTPPTKLLLGTLCRKGTVFVLTISVTLGWTISSTCIFHSFLCFPDTLFCMPVMPACWTYQRPL